MSSWLCLLRGRPGARIFMAIALSICSAMFVQIAAACDINFAHERHVFCELRSEYRQTDEEISKDGNEEVETYGQFHAKIGNHATKALRPVAAAGRVPTGGEKVVQCLEREGVEVVFGLPGGAAIPLFDALYESKIKLILTRHEQGATHMADGYARATGKTGRGGRDLGSGRDQHGHGPAHRALRLGADGRALCGQVIRPMLGKDGFQEADVTGITYAAVKHSFLVKDANDIPRVIKEAFYIATTGRPGPVLVDLPKDVWPRPCPAPFVDRVELPGYHVPDHADPEALKQTGGLPGQGAAAGSARRPRRRARPTRARPS